MFKACWGWSLGVGWVLLPSFCLARLTCEGEYIYCRCQPVCLCVPATIFGSVFELFPWIVLLAAWGYLIYRWTLNAVLFFTNNDFANKAVTIENSRTRAIMPPPWTSQNLINDFWAQNLTPNTPPVKGTLSPSPLLPLTSHLPN